MTKFSQFIDSEIKLTKRLIDYLNNEEENKEIYLNVKIISVTSVLGIMLGKFLYETERSPQETFNKYNEAIKAVAMNVLKSLQEEKNHDA